MKADYQCAPGYFFDMHAKGSYNYYDGCVPGCKPGNSSPYSLLDLVFSHFPSFSFTFSYSTRHVFEIELISCTDLFLPPS